MATARAAAASAAAEELLAIVPRLNRWAESSVSSSANDLRLSLRQLSALSMIEDEVTTLGDVAKRLHVTPAVVTGLIDRLERRGYVQRINSTDDRRRVMLTLTESGRAASLSATAGLAAQLEQSLVKLDSEDLQIINRALERLEPITAELETR
ncbi:MarR family transcriptional regulator [soil metagenome]